MQGGREVIMPFVVSFLALLFYILLVALCSPSSANYIKVDWVHKGTGRLGRVSPFECTWSMDNCKTLIIRVHTDKATSTEMIESASRVHFLVCSVGWLWLWFLKAPTIFMV